MNRQLVVLNPRAGRMQASRRLGELLPLLEGDGVVAELLETSAPGEAREAVKDRAGEFCRVVCIGGDGTLNEVISFSSGTRIILNGWREVPRIVPPLVSMPEKSREVSMR